VTFSAGHGSGRQRGVQASKEQRGFEYLPGFRNAFDTAHRHIPSKQRVRFAVHIKFPYEIKDPIENSDLALRSFFERKKHGYPRSTAQRLPIGFGLKNEDFLYAARLLVQNPSFRVVDGAAGSSTHKANNK
jgi:hypothetical protein